MGRQGGSAAGNLNDSCCLPDSHILWLTSRYDSLKCLLREIQSEIVKRQSYSDSISGSSFLPVIQSLVNPYRDQRKSSRSRSETRPKSVRVASSPLLSDLSVNDTTPNLSIYSPSVARITPLSSASATPLAIKSESLTPRSQSDCSEVCPIVG